MTHSEQVARDCIDRAKQNWGNGWNRLSNVQRKEAVSFEIMSTLMAQDNQWTEDPLVALSTLKHINAVAFAAAMALENFGGDYAHEN